MIKGQYTIDETKRKSLFKDYPFFYEKFYLTIKKAIEEFFEKPFETRLMSITEKENILFFGDEYFVNNIQITPTTNFKIKSYGYRDRDSEILPFTKGHCIS